MDLANYLIELLGQRGEVSVPGLGSFTHERLNGYYDEETGRLHPPGKTLSFRQHTDTQDNAFAAFISQKKNISMASARYFIDRYANDTLQEALVNDVAIGNKGWLHNDGVRLIFKNQDVQTANADYFGLPVIEIRKKAQPQQKVIQVVLTPPPPVQVTEAVPQQQAEPVTLVEPSPQPVEATEPDTFDGEEKKGLNKWVLTAIVIALLAIAAIGVYMYNPGMFGVNEKAAAAVPSFDSVAQDEPDTTVQETPADTGASTPVKTDTSPETTMSLGDTVKTTVITPQQHAPVQKSTKTTATPATAPGVKAANNIGYPYIVIIGGSFATVEEAEKCIVNYKKIGIDAHILAEKGYGKKRKVVVGTYKTTAEALEERKKLIKSKKVRDDAYTLEITKKR